MSDKYIIRSCKALIRNDICELYSQKGIHLMAYCYCRDKNCVLKQIYEICKNNALIGGIDETAEKVVDLLDIQECGDED